MGKIAIFSDVHGNIAALTEALLLMQQQELDQLVFCGDVCGYYYQYNEAIDLLRDQRNMMWVLGNHDKNVLDIADGKQQEADLVDRYGMGYHRVLERLGRDRIDFLRTLPSEKKDRIAQCEICVVHTLPGASMEARWYPDQTAPDNIEQACAPFDFVFCGHTHFRMVKQIGRTTLVNPGSVGQPRDRNGFGFALVETKSSSVEFISFCPDLTQLEREIQAKERKIGNLIEILHRGKKD